MTSREQPDAAAVAFKGVAHSVPSAAHVTALDAGRVELDAAAVASDGVVQFTPPGA